MATYGDVAKWQIFNDSGAFADGWKLNTYLAGTSTPKTTYQDVAETNANTNPVIFDSRGEATILFDGSYKLVLTDENDFVKWTIDNYSSDAGTVPTNDSNLALNGSFELDADADAVPDNWTLTTLGSFLHDGTDAARGGKSVKFTSVGSGGGDLVSADFFEANVTRFFNVSFTYKSSVVDVRNIVEIFWYKQDKTAAATPKTIVWDEAAANATSWAAKFFEVQPPALAAYAKIKLIGCDSSDATPGSTWFDDIAVTMTPHHNNFGSLVSLSKGADVASASPLVLSADGNFFDVTGTTGITSISTVGVGTEVTLQFDGALTITHHATDLILPDSADIITAAGDTFIFREYAAGDWLLVSRNGVNIQRKGSDVASAIALPLINDGDFFDVTGTTNITSFNSIGVGREITLQFDGALILNHHATDLILPGGANILTAAGDVFTFREYASGDWLLVGQGVAISATTATISGDFTVTGGASSIATASGNNLSLTATDAALPIIIGTGAGDDFTINTTGLVYEGDTGEVGIGTLPDAGARLHVHRSSGNTIVRLSTANRAADGFYLQIVNSTQEMRLFQSEDAAITIWTNGIKRMDIDEDGVVTVPGSLDLGGGAVAGDSVVADLAAGKYTPTLTNTTNVAASTAYECQYMRVGDVVTVSGRVDIDVTAATTATSLLMTLPIASSLGNVYECGGTASPFNVSAVGGGIVAILAEVATDQVKFAYVSGSTTTSISYFFSFTYQII